MSIAPTCARRLPAAVLSATVAVWIASCQGADVLGDARTCALRCDSGTSLAEPDGGTWADAGEHSPDGGAQGDGGVAETYPDLGARVQWVHATGTPRYDVTPGVLVEPDGSLLSASVHVYGEKAPESERALILERFDPDGRVIGTWRWSGGTDGSLLMHAGLDGGVVLAVEDTYVQFTEEEEDAGTGGPRTVIVSVSPTFEVQWEVRVPNQWLADMETDEAGNTAVLSYPSGMSSTSVPRLDVYGSAGNWRWGRPLESYGSGGLNGMILANTASFLSNGDIVVAGQTYGGFTMDGQAFEPSTLASPLLLRLSGKDGRLIWGRLLDGATGSFAYLVRIQSGELLTAGALTGADGAAWGGDWLEGPGRVYEPPVRNVVAALTEDGQPLWGRQLPTDFVAGAGLQLVGAGGDALVVTQALGSRGCRPPGVMRIGPHGELGQPHVLHGDLCSESTWVSVYSAALLPDGRLSLGGTFAGTVDFGAETRTASGPTDAFLLMLTPP